MSIDHVAPGRPAGPTGVIHDIGYQRYDGPRLGRSYAVRSLYVHSLRTAFGLGRSGKAKIFPWSIAGLVGIVAAVLTVIRAQSGEQLVTYAAFPASVNFLVILFCAAMAPELVSRDLRSGVLPLYFSRPLSRDDYALAKLAALTTAVFVLLAAPLLLIFTGGAFSVHGAHAVWNEFVDFLPGLAVSAVYAAVCGSLALLVAALVSRRAVAAAAVVAVFLVSTPIYGVVAAVGGEHARQVAGILSPTTLLSGLGTWLFGGNGIDVGPYGPVYGFATVAVVSVALLLLLSRYRRVAR
jgi:ABC-2 type transport system permease protein